MRKISLIAFMLAMGLQGCATSSGTVNNDATQGSSPPASTYLNRNDAVASPAARLSGDSGAMHSGMSASPR